MKDSKLPVSYVLTLNFPPYNFTSQYDQYKPSMENIGMQDSLLSRFDLLFIVLDEMEPENDRRISDHVLRIHRYRSPQEQDGDRK